MYGLWNRCGKTQILFQLKITGKGINFVHNHIITEHCDPPKTRGTRDSTGKIRSQASYGIPSK